MSTRRGIISIIFGTLIALFNSIFQFVLMFLLIVNYGAQFNGLIKNVMAIVGFIGLTEAGIGVMCAVLLYKPLMQKDWMQANQLLSTTHRQNRIVGFVSIGILLAIAVVYSLYVNFIQGGIVLSGATINAVSLNLGFLILIVIFIGGKNLLSLFLVGAYEALMIADQNNYMRKIIFLIVDLLVYSLIFYLITLQPSPVIIFLPFVFYSLLKVGLVMIFVKRRYPWLKLSRQSPNWRLVRMAGAVSLRSLGLALLVNTDIIIVSLVLNLKFASVVSLYMTISFGVREIMLLFINSFKEIFASWIAKNGRVNWQSYQKFELYAYMIAAFTFVNQFVSSPYFVNALYGNQIYKAIIIENAAAYDTVFLSPTFALLIAIFSVILVISEPINVLIYAKGCYRQVSKAEVWFGSVNVLLAVICALCFRFIQNNDVNALYSIVIVNIIVLFARYLFLRIFNRMYLTYNASFKGNFKNMLVLLLPIVISLLVVYLYLYPSATFSYREANALGREGKSLVLTWSFAKLIEFFLVIIFSSIAIIAIIGFIFAPGLVLGILRRLPIVYYIIMRWGKTKPSVNDLFDDDITNFFKENHQNLFENGENVKQKTKAIYVLREDKQNKPKPPAKI